MDKNENKFFKGNEMPTAISKTEKIFIDNIHLIYKVKSMKQEGHNGPGLLT